MSEIKRLKQIIKEQGEELQALDNLVDEAIEIVHDNDEDVGDEFRERLAKIRQHGIDK